VLGVLAALGAKAGTRGQFPARPTAPETREAPRQHQIGSIEAQGGGESAKMQTAFSLALNQQISPGLVAVGKFDGL
jgi:hypothetical protein